jgi:uncharacterized protein (TIGR04255 family)
MLWELYKDRYPNIEEHPKFPPVFETFGLPTPQPGPQITFSTGVEALRYWFVSADSKELLQVQSDRLVHNWRRQQPEAPYPRYETQRENFASELALFRKFLIDGKRGDIELNQCEVTYINHITLPDVKDPASKFGNVFTVWSENYSDKYLPEIERSTFNISYVIPGEKDQPFGRLHVIAQPAFKKATSERLIQLTLTMRGRPPGPSIESGLEWLDKGREIVVRAFASITRPEMHALWGRKNV